MDNGETTGAQLTLTPGPDQQASEDDKAAADKAGRKRRQGSVAAWAEPRVVVILTTSRLSDAEGNALVRGRAVSVREQRLETLIAKGKVREAGEDSIASAVRRFGPVVELA